MNFLSCFMWTRLWTCPARKWRRALQASTARKSTHSAVLGPKARPVCPQGTACLVGPVAIRLCRPVAHLWLGSIQDLQVAASIIGKAAIAIPSRPPRLHLEFHRNLHGGNRMLIKSKNLIWGDQEGTTASSVQQQEQRHTSIWIWLNEVAKEGQLPRMCLVHENFWLSLCICQLVSNHGLIRLKRFISWFSTKLYN
jgi:hypothetical protein